jgi:hypothetical protein
MKFNSVRMAAALVLLAGPLAAQVPAIAEIPGCTTGPERTQLEQSRAALVQRRDQLKSRTAEHNGRCGKVVQGSADEASCRTAQGQLSATIGQYAGAVTEFNKQAEAAKAACRQPDLPHPRIGAAAAVRGTVYWLTSDGRKVPITSGGPIYLGSRIVTGADGHLQVLLLDETVFTVGANSDFVVDDFFYDPVTTAGKIATSLVKGTFRWVTGKVSHPDPAALKMKLPIGTIGIRGTDFEVQYQPDAAGYIKLFSGELELTEQETGALSRMKAGQMVVIGTNGSWGAPIALSQ